MYLPSPKELYASKVSLVVPVSLKHDQVKLGKFGEMSLGRTLLSQIDRCRLRQATHLDACKSPVYPSAAAL